MVRRHGKGIGIQDCRKQLEYPKEIANNVNRTFIEAQPIAFAPVAFKASGINWHSGKPAS